MSRGGVANEYSVLFNSNWSGLLESLELGDAGRSCLRSVQQLIPDPRMWLLWQRDL